MTEASTTNGTGNTVEEPAADEKQKVLGTDPLAWLENEEESNNANVQVTETEENSMESTDSADLVLEDNLHISGLESLHEQLMSCYENKQDICLDASQIQKADAASLQLLVSFYQSAPVQGVNVTWKGCSDAFIEASQQVGLSSLLGIESS